MSCPSWSSSDFHYSSCLDNLLPETKPDSVLRSGSWGGRSPKQIRCAHISCCAIIPWSFVYNPLRPPRCRCRPRLPDHSWSHAFSFGPERWHSGPRIASKHPFKMNYCSRTELLFSKGHKKQTGKHKPTHIFQCFRYFKQSCDLTEACMQHLKSYWLSVYIFSGCIPKLPVTTTTSENEWLHTGCSASCIVVAPIKNIIDWPIDLNTAYF